MTWRVHDTPCVKHTFPVPLREKRGMCHRAFRALFTGPNDIKWNQTRLLLNRFARFEACRIQCNQLADRAIFFPSKFS